MAMRQVLMAATLCLSVAGTRAASDVAAGLLRTAGVQAGLVVHVGCGDGRLTAALRENDRLLVHGLDTDPAKIAEARKHIRARELYGPVSVDLFDGQALPYADNLVNLLVVSNPDCRVSEAELMRVLAPRGVLLRPNAARRTRHAMTTKPWPADMDHWTHYLYSASNNAVSRDRQVGPPNRLQWSAEPLWPRSHEYTPSLASLVSAEGRIFYLHDDGLRGVLDKRLPERWFVYARDAFNGLLLWRVPLPNWGPLEWGHARHWHTPLALTRRLVATGGRVYVTLGYRAPVSVLDADTGAVIRTFEDTANADEILCTGDTLVVRQRKTIPDYAPGAEAWNIHVRAKAGKKTPKAWTQLPEAEKQPQSILAVDTVSGELRWRVDCDAMVTLSLAATDRYVCYHNFDEVVCLRFRDGKELWRAASKSWPDLTGTSGTLLLHDDAVYHTGTSGLEAWDAATGAVLWTGPRIARTTIRHPPDLFIANGLLWGGLTPDMPTGRIPHEEAPGVAPAMRGRLVQGLYPKTGKVARELEIGALISPGHHVRCYRARATERFLMWPKRGIEFVDIVNGSNHQRCNWVRGECSYGLIPANGLIYAPPHPCLCNLGVVLTGFNALASSPEQIPPASEQELQRGPAYGTALLESNTATGPDWPMYRHDGARSGRTSSRVPNDLSVQWTQTIGGRLTPPVAAAGRIVVASSDTHTVHALDTAAGDALWSFTAGGPIDSPPALHRGLLVFGCRDGHVYCLRANDGELVWRFRAGPAERRIVAMGQLEAPWPVSGSVLIEGDVAYFAAGRSSFLDGGVRLFGLDVGTGRIRYEHCFAGPEPDIANTPGPTYHMEGTKADLLSTDGTSIFLLFQTFDMALNRLPTPPGNRTGGRKITRRLAPRNGFLDTTWFDRTSWTHGERWLGRHFKTGVPGAGQIIVFDDTTTYALQVFSKQFFMSPHFTPGNGYLLRADRLGTEPAANAKRRPKPRWSIRVPLRARGMVLADETLFLAGPPDVIPPDDPYAAFEGRAGAVLWAVAAKDGARQCELPLPHGPVPDGLIAAGGRLVLSTTDGNVICLGGSRPTVTPPSLPPVP